MGFLDSLGKFLSGPGAVSGLARAESVEALAPDGSVYATVGAVVVLPDAAAFTGGPPGQGRLGRDLGWVPGDQVPALLVRTPEALLAIAESGIVWQRRLGELVALDAHRRGGFVIFARDGGGLGVSVQTPVQVPPGSSLRTIGRSTNAFGGWDNELDVPHHW